MNTIFEIKDLRRGDTRFSCVTRPYYKKVIVLHDIRGGFMRTGTNYRDGNPVKQLTFL